MFYCIEHHVACLEKLLHKIHDVVLVVRPVTSDNVIASFETETMNSRNFMLVSFMLEVM